MKDWSDLNAPTRREAHFGDRVVTCFTERPVNYFAMVAGAAAIRPEEEALICGETRLTWQMAEARALRFARGLRKRGIGPGDRVALFIGNSIEFAIALFACTRIGAIVVPISIREQKDGLRYVLDHCGARMIIHERSLVGLVDAAAEGQMQRICPDPCPGSTLFAELYEEEGELPPADAVREEDILTIIYTSGTTGLPKGVTFSHLSVIHAAMSYALCIGLGARDRSVLCVPLSFTGGLISAFSPLVYCGGEVVILPEFKAAQFLATAARERMTHTLMVPAMYELCLRQPDIDAYDLAAWEFGVFGAAPMPTATIERLARRLPRLKLMNSYGASEAGGPAVFMRAADTAANPDSVGQAFPCVELAIMDDDGIELPLGSTGEIWIRSPGCSAGFWNDPERSRAEYFGGYWRSGDIGILGEDGLLRLLDRKKDMINRGGLKISSTQVEEILYRHGSVIECAVIGRPDEVMGEKVQAFVWTEDRDLTEETLRGLCREHLADYKVPEFMTFTDAPLPRNTNGKILKRVLRDRLQGG